MSFGGDAAGRAPLMTLVNTQTNEVLEVQFNPTEFSKALGANYARQQVPGLSHEVLQFVNTKNQTFKVQLFFRTAGESPGDADRTLDAVAYLDALVTPREVQNLFGGGPPRALFVWPRFVSLSCVVTDLAYTFQRFALDGRPCAFVVDVALEEIRDVHVTSSQIRLQGNLRGGTQKVGT